MHPSQNILQYKINQIKLKPGLNRLISRLIQTTAWKWTRSILEVVDIRQEVNK